MNERELYLNYTVEENMEYVRKYIDKGFLSWSMFESRLSDKISLIINVYGDILSREPSLLPFIDDIFVACLRVVGEASEKVFKQLEDIRSGEAWKR